MSVHQLHLPCPPERALGAVGPAAAACGAKWLPRAGGGSLELPVSAGVRLGIAAGEVSVAAVATGSELVFEVRSCTYQLRRSALALLLLAAAGALLVVAAPFVAHLQPRLLGAIPLAAVLALGGWFLVVSQLRTVGPDDFLQLVADMAAEPEDAGDHPGGE